jgi:hypothetical protein
MFSRADAALQIGRPQIASLADDRRRSTGGQTERGNGFDSPDTVVE